MLLALCSVLCNFKVSFFGDVYGFVACGDGSLSGMPCSATSFELIVIEYHIHIVVFRIIFSDFTVFITRHICTALITTTICNLFCDWLFIAVGFLIYDVLDRDGKLCFFGCNVRLIIRGVARDHGKGIISRLTERIGEGIGADLVVQHLPRCAAEYSIINLKGHTFD